MASHALLNASSSKRWLNCPPSARLEEPIPDRTSTFAEEGTFAHGLAELKLRAFLKEIDEQHYGAALAREKENKYYSVELEEYVDEYVDYVKELYMELKAASNDIVMLLEQRLDYSPWVQEGFGTGDVVIITDGILYVIDLKFGQGTPVSVEHNPQLMLYGLGAYNVFSMIYPISLVKMVIHQVRTAGPSTFEMSMEDLLAWGESTVKPIAEKAYKGEGEQASGEWCKFCKVNVTCRKRAEDNLELARLEFKKPPLLTKEEVAAVLVQAELIQAWASDVKDFALDAATNHGIKWPGWKVVEGTSRRIIKDADALARDLELSGYRLGQIYKPKELRGIGDLEKIVGKKVFAQSFGGYIVKPPGKPTLAPESDKRPEINSTASAVSDFAESALFGEGVKQHG